MRIRAPGLVLLVAAALGAWAGQPSFDAARRAAAVGDYRTAIQEYQQLLERSGFSAPVLFNLGNAWLRMGNPARAILDYERALVLAPGSAAIQANLAAAQQRAGIAPTAAGPWLQAARHFSFDTYLWVCLAAIWVLCVALVLLSVDGSGRRLTRALILVSVLMLCVGADAAVLCWPDLYRAVVQEPAVLHLAPAQSAATGGTLAAGEVVWLQDRFGAFTLVRTADGHVGWVDDTTVLPVRVSRP
ncbi:MAG TPA: tetratricopeptide repeat protein [Steroidobacteraceae bacterium]|nr:tetratricopeptide repeat protein [Steroidobacteraceae bacterium]